MSRRLKRSLSVLELVQIQRIFSLNRSYKDLIRDFKKDFNVDLDKQTAKRFIKSRSWSEVLEWLTGDKIEPPPTCETIPQLERKRYDLLIQMLKAHELDNADMNERINAFEADDYFINENVHYFNFPLYGEIITYKFKEPFLKCFLLDDNTHKIKKIEDVPVTPELPDLMFRIIKKINASKIKTDDINNMFKWDEEAEPTRKNIFDSDLFNYLNFTFK